MEVHKQLGNGFLEKVYHQALQIEFQRKNIPYASEVEIPVYYRGVELKAKYKADFVCYGSIIVEIKAIKQLTDNEKAQVINYLKASNFEIGVLLNFGAPSLQHKRFFNKFKG